MPRKLAEARKAAGLTQEEVAEEIGVERTTYGKWERGESTPQPQQRSKLASTIKVSLTELHGMLSNLPHADGEVPNWLTIALAVEQSATEIRAHELCVVYGLLQSADYAAAIARSVGIATMDDEYVSRNISQRAHRQQRVLNGDVTLHVVQPEGALRSRLGSDETMADQMRRLVDLAALENVTIQVVPFNVGQYEAQRLGIFSLQFHPWAVRPRVNLEVYGGVRFIDDADELDYFSEAFNQAARLALSPAASVGFIEDLAKEWET